MWTQDFVYMQCEKGTDKVLTIPRGQAIIILADEWDDFIHKRFVAERPGASD